MTSQRHDDCDAADTWGQGPSVKMTKPQLQQMVAKTAPPATSKGYDSNPDRPKGDLELEPDDHSGGHYFRTDGKTVTGIEAVASAKVSDVASAMVVIKVKSDCHTDTTPNAKHEILQPGFVGDRSHFQVSEPIIGLSTWNTNLAMVGGGNDFQLHLTISPGYLRDVMYDVSGQMGCPVHDGAAGRFGSTDPTIKKNQVYLRVKSVQLHVA